MYANTYISIFYAYFGATATRAHTRLHKMKHAEWIMYICVVRFSFVHSDNKVIWAIIIIIVAIHVCHRVTLQLFSMRSALFSEQYIIEDSKHKVKLCEQNIHIHTLCMWMKHVYLKCEGFRLCFFTNAQQKEQIFSTTCTSASRATKQNEKKNSIRKCEIVSEAKGGSRCVNIRVTWMLQHNINCCARIRYSGLIRCKTYDTVRIHFTIILTAVT